MKPILLVVGLVVIGIISCHYLEAQGFDHASKISYTGPESIRHRTECFGIYNGRNQLIGGNCVID